jgi:hypothetical protein
MTVYYRCILINYLRMKNILSFTLALFIASTALQAQTITTFPHSEGFESGSIPAGWTQEHIANAIDWAVVEGSLSTGIPITTHSGTYKARFSATSKGPKTKLVTPQLDLTEAAAYTLRFWHTQHNWGADLDTLRVYYKTSAGGEWNLIDGYEEQLQNWTEHSYTLPDCSADYYIAFEGISGWGYGVMLDDVLIEPVADTPPAISGDAVLDFGMVYSGLTTPFTKSYTVVNTGGQPLEISGAAGESAGITVEGVPTTVPPLQSIVITVKLDAQELPVGAYSGSFTLLSNDPATPEFEVNVSAGVVNMPAPYIQENFNRAMSENWITQRLARRMIGGVGNTPCVSGEIYSYARECFIQTSHVQMGETPVLTFMYSATTEQYDPVTDQTTTIPADAGTFAYSAAVSKDNGITWENITLTPASGTQTQASGYAQVSGDVSAFAGEELCMVKITFNQFDFATINVSIDNINAGTMPDTELEAVSLTGNTMPIVGVEANYTLKVANNGALVQNGYSVKLMMQGEQNDTEIATIAGTVINAGEEKEFTFAWTPEATGEVVLYGEIEIADDALPENNRSEVVLTVYSEGHHIVTVGAGSAKSDLPYSLYYPASVTQTLYYPNELGTNGGEIRQIVYSADMLHAGNYDDTPIRVWMGETDTKTLTNGWINPSTLTEVFNGTIDFPAGAYEVTVPLSTPYEYEGKILVVYSHKALTAQGNSSDGFMSLFTPGTARSRVQFNNSDIDPMSPALGQIVYYIPNTTLLMDLAQTGSLTGIVTDGDSPLKGVDVTLGGSLLSTVTDETGHYAFPHLAAGEYTVEANMYGYVGATGNVTVVTGADAVLNIEIEAMPLCTVSGKVTGSDAPNGLAGATVTLSGYDSYEAVSSNDGTWAIDSVYGNSSYTIAARLAGYASYNGTIELTGADSVRNILLVEIPYPVNTPEAVEEGNNVVVTWLAPGPFETTYLIDDGTAEFGFSFQPNYERWAGNMMQTGESGILTSIDVYGIAYSLNTGKVVRVEIFDEQQQPVGVSEEFILPSDEWVNVPLNNVPYSGTFYAMVKWGATEGYSNTVGIDQTGEHAASDADMRYDGYEWSVLHQAYGYLPGVFMIRANAISSGESKTSYGYGTTEPHNTTAPVANAHDAVFEKQPANDNANAVCTQSRQQVKAITPTPTSYSVYRLPEGETDEAAWIGLATVTETSFMDAGWQTLSAGSYQYAIVAEYAGNNRSEARLTNTLRRDVMFTVTYEQPANGTLTVTVGGEAVVSGSMVDYNTVLTITATPVEGYELELLTVNSADFTSGGTHTVTADVEIECAFKKTDVGLTKQPLAGITVYGNKNNVHITNPHSIPLKSIQITDMLGRVVYNGKAATSTVIPVNGTNGIYIVKLISDEGKVSTTKLYLTK